MIAAEMVEVVEGATDMNSELNVIGTTTAGKAEVV